MRKLIFCSGIVWLLAACGGGGGGGGGSGGASSPPPPVMVSVTCPNGTTQTATTMDLANSACPRPLLVSVLPSDANAAVSVDTFHSVDVVIDSTLDATSITATNVSLKAGATAISGAVSAVGTKSLKFVPTAKLMYSQAYSFSATVKDTLGKVLTVTSTFTTAAISCSPSQRASIDGKSCLSPPVCKPPNILSDPWTCLPPPSLVDSGQTQCDNGSGVLAPCTSANVGDASSLPRQDGRFGRDVSANTGKLTKIGGGASGFDYSKISNGGGDLGAGVGLQLGSKNNDWACTRDNITGLTWEVKVDNSQHLRHFDWKYQWYNTDSNTNGGNVGVASISFFPAYAPYCKTDMRCDTEKYVADVNAAALCGYTDWRMPTARELLTLVDAGKYNPSIDEDYFPNTSYKELNGQYQTATTFLESQYSLSVSFVDGGTFGGQKDKTQANVHYVRLVRGQAY